MISQDCQERSISLAVVVCIHATRTSKYAFWPCRQKPLARTSSRASLRVLADLWKVYPLAD